jgi:drug/metabolite transporter (DMT)-like permease
VALTFWRWVVALALISPVVVPRLWAQRATLRQHWRPLVVLGVLGGGLHNVLQYWGLHYTTATNGAILTSLTPVYVLLMGAAFYRDPLTPLSALGAFVAILGVLALVFQLDFAALLAFKLNPGDALIIASHIMIGGYTVYLRRWPAGLDALSFLASFALLGLVPVGIAYLYERSLGMRIVVTPGSMAALAYVAVFPALLAYHFWNLGVAAIGSARSAMFFYLTPLFGSLLAVVLLGERLGAHHVAGLALILGGITLANRRKPR